MSKNKQRIRSLKELGYADGMSKRYGPTGRYTVWAFNMNWPYRSGYNRALRKLYPEQYVKKTKEDRLKRATTIALDVIVGFIIIVLVLYCAGLVGR